MERSRIRVLRGRAGHEAKAARVELPVQLQERTEVLLLLQRRDQLRLLSEHDRLLVSELKDQDWHDLDRTGCRRRRASSTWRTTIR